MQPCPFCDASAGAIFCNKEDGTYFAECVESLGGCGLISADFATRPQAFHWWQTGEIKTPSELVRTDEAHENADDTGWPS